MLKELQQELIQIADPAQGQQLARYFKTGPGEYGEGDEFLGIRVPELRKRVKKYQQLSSAEIKKLLCSKVHEYRLMALLILVQQFQQADDAQQEKIYRFYLAHTRYINNWDLVDSSAPKIVGAWLYKRNKDILKQLAHSTTLWERRIAILSCFYFIQYHSYTLALQIARILLKDEEDLIHKAVGWMLREIGKRDRQVEEKFLQQHYRTMPRTMLRYAIEHFPQRLRQAYLQGRI